MVLGVAVEAKQDLGGPGGDPLARGTSARLRHEPALDGLRGLAVAVVVLFHLGRMRGGFLGVDLFFVLSGFLITSLLLAESTADGSIGLGRFWARRARRLLPALFVLLVGVAVLIATLTPAGERPTVRGDALATLGYVANWHALFDEAGYWDMFLAPSPLDHMWSLAIEEQFYVVWPLVVLGLVALARRWRRAGPAMVAAFSAVGAAVSFIVLALVYSPLDTNRAYYGTDARVGPTLLGAALAALSVDRLRARAAGGGEAEGGSPSWCRRVVGAAAVAVMVWALAAVDGIGPTYYRGGLVAFSAAAVALIHVVTTGDAGALGRLLRARPLAALGVVSYGVYLWHWPVIVYLTPERARVDGWALDGLRVAVTLGLAVVSYRLVERPIRRGALAGLRIRVGLVGAVAVTATAVVVATAGVARVPGTEMALSADGAGYTLYPDVIPEGAPRILLVGDSGPAYLGSALADEAARAGAVAATASQPFCTVLEPEGTTRWPDGSVSPGEPCHDMRRREWGDMVERFQPDVVVYYLAAGGGAAELLMDGRWLEECEPDYDGYLAGALRADADVLGAGGATVVLATTPEAPFVVGGQKTLDALACRRATLDAVARVRPGTAVIDMAAAMKDVDAQVDEDVYRDMVHVSDAGAARLVEWLVPTVLDLRPAPIA